MTTPKTLKAFVAPAVLPTLFAVLIHTDEDAVHVLGKCANKEVVSDKIQRLLENEEIYADDLDQWDLFIFDAASGSQFELERSGVKLVGEKKL